MSTVATARSSACEQGKTADIQRNFRQRLPTLWQSIYIKIGSVCPSVCATVSTSINPLPSDRLRCCDQYIHCQQSLAVKPLNSRPAMSGSPSHRGSVRRMSTYQFTHVQYQTAAAGRAWWQLANWRMRGANWLSESSLTATARGAGVGLWTLTHMCSITQTDATSNNRALRDCGLYV